MTIHSKTPTATAAVPDASGPPFGPAVTAVLRAAAAEIERRTGEPIAFDGVLANPGALNHLLGLLIHPSAYALRTAARSALPDAQLETLSEALPETGSLDRDDDGELARALTAPDAASARDAAAIVTRRVDDERKARRRARRRNATPALQRSLDRDRIRLERLREQRDRVHAQLSTVTDENRTLRAQVNDLLGDVAALTTRLKATEHRLDAARADTTNPKQLAGNLAKVLRHVDATDSESTAPAEPDPSPAALSAAAQQAGLPVSLAEQASRWLPKMLAALAAPPASVQVKPDRILTVDVLGGGTEVGGSCVLVTAGDTRLLVDAGSRPNGTDAATMAPRHIDRALAHRLDAIIVTHAHNDHAGWVPVLVAKQPDLPVIVTDATAALLATMWEDSAKVLSRRMRQLLNKQDGTALLPPFNREDVQRALSRLQIVDLNTIHRIGELQVELFPAGHIVGAAGVVVHAGTQRAVISGDVSKTGQVSVGGLVLPDSARGADLLVLESTYAGSDRQTPRAAAVHDFLRDIAQTVAGGGTVLVPAFALGRAQEVTLLLAQNLPDIDVLVDGLARDVCEIYEQQPGPDGQPMSIFSDRIRPVPRGHTHAEIARKRPGVVVATSGMLQGGPSVQWARKILPDPRNRLMVVGYQDEESPGNKLITLARAGGGTFNLPNPEGIPEPVPVLAPVSTYGLGAHADANDLVTISAQVAARQVMLVHGDLTGQRAFAKRLRLRGQDTLLADQTWIGS